MLIVFGTLEICEEATVESRFSMVELYRKLFLEMSSESGEGRIAEEPCHRAEDRDARDAELLVVWHSLEFFEKRAGRSMASASGRLTKHSKEKNVSSLFDRKSLVAIWTHAELAWQDGWPSALEAPGREIKYWVPSIYNCWMIEKSKVSCLIMFEYFNAWNFRLFACSNA